MNKAKILKASKNLWKLETAQDHFNNAINELSDEELAVFIKENNVTIEPQPAKERIQKALNAKKQTGDKK